jgi:hypothetical protein
VVEVDSELVVLPMVLMVDQVVVLVMELVVVELV